MDHTDFLRQAFLTIARALAVAGVEANLHCAPATLSKSVKRRCLAELRRLTVLIRRLIFLMALSVELTPVNAREGRNWFREDDTKPVRRRGLRIAPAASGVFPGNIRGFSGVRPAGPVDAAPVIARWTALLEALKHRERRAKSLARTLQRWRAVGEAKPYVLPMPGTHRMPAALGLVSNALVLRLTEALKDWPDTG